MSSDNNVSLTSELSTNELELEDYSNIDLFEYIIIIYEF